MASGAAPHMQSPSSSLPLPVLEAGGEVRLSLKVQPRAARSGLAGVADGALKVRVTAPPVDAAANEAVRELLAEVLDVPRGAVRLVHGATSRNKIVAVAGLPAATVSARLAAALPRE